MAIKYEFSCHSCNYQVQLTVGLTMIEHYRKDPDIQLASCNICKILTTSKNRRCSTCNKKAETGRWFSRKTGFKILDSSMMRKDSDIPCPKCDFNSLKAIPIVFID